MIKAVRLFYQQNADNVVISNDDIFFVDVDSNTITNVIKLYTLTILKLMMKKILKLLFRVNFWHYDLWLMVQ